MSANQAMSSARRRRGNPPPPAARSAGRGPIGSVEPQSATPEQNSSLVPSAAPTSFVPVPVTEARTPVELVQQHDRRLFNLENGMAEAIGVINSNIDVLTDGYNSVASGTDTSVLDSLRAELRSLCSRVAALEDARSGNSDDEVGVSFTQRGDVNEVNEVSEVSE